MGKINNENLIEIKTGIIKELFSKEMSDYFCKDINLWTDDTFAEIIGGSLLNIHKKYEYAKQLGLEVLEKECKVAIDKLERKEGEIFYLRELSRNTDLELLLNNKEKHKHFSNDIIRAIDVIDDEVGIGDLDHDYGIMPLLDYKSALKYIHDDKIEEGYQEGFDYDSYYYYKLQKYKKRTENDDLKDVNEYLCWFIGDMYLDAEYYIVNGNISYFIQYDYSSIGESEMPSWDSSSIIYNSRDLNLPIPFKAGDLVSCKLKPFANDKNLLIVSIGDNSDCCSVQVAYINEYGKLKVGALKHTSIMQHIKFPCISPLYTLKTISIDDLDKKEIMEFCRLQDKINGDEKKGRTLLNDLWNY